MSSITAEQEIFSSSSSSERMTIAYSETPAIASSDSEATGSSDYTSSSSTSLETPQSEQSYTSLFENIKQLLSVSHRDLRKLLLRDRPCAAIRPDILFKQAKKQAEFFGYEPRRSAASLHDGPQLNGLEFFWSHNIFQLFCFMMSHLLAHTPDEPVAFLTRLVDRCLLYRDRGGDPPLLFEEPHVRSVYTALDPGGDGHIRYTQYVTGMKTLGLSDFNLLPGEVEYLGKDVEEELFVSEARQALLLQLDSMLGCSRPAVISRDLMADYRGSHGEGSSAPASAVDWSAHTFEVTRAMTSGEIMTKLNPVHGGAMPGLISSHSIAGRSVVSSKDLVTKYMRDQDMGFVSSSSFTDGGGPMALKNEFLEQKDPQSTIGSIQKRSSRELHKMQTYDLEKSEVGQDVNRHTVRAADSVVTSRTSERPALEGSEPSNLSLETSKQNTLRSDGDINNIEALSKENLFD